MKTLKKLLPLSIAALASAPVLADVSANIGVTSNYIWRGLSQTDDNAAVSGGIDYEHESGFYAGTWVSNVDFGEDATGAETDLYFGWSGETAGFGYGISYIYYLYSDINDSDFSEIAIDVSYSFLSAGLAYTISDEVPSAEEDTRSFAEDDVYYYVTASGDLGHDWGASLTFGYYDFENDDSDNDLSYTYWQIDVSKSAGDFGDFTWSLVKANAGTNDDGSDVVDEDEKFVVSWSKSF